MKLSARKMIWLIIALIVIFVIYAIYYYNQIQQDHWKEQRLAKQIAYEQIGLTEPLDVELYSGELSYQVVFGKNEHEQDMIVWVHDQSVTHYVYANDGISKDEIVDKVMKQYPDANLIRTVPGIKDDEIVWEVFYKRNSDDGVRPYYDYYRFSDGEWMDTYTLSLIR